MGMVFWIRIMCFLREIIILLYMYNLSQTHTYMLICIVSKESVVASQGLRATPIDRENTDIAGKSQVIWAGYCLKISFLKCSFHDTRKYYATCQEREANKQSYPATITMSHSNDQHGKNSSWYNKWQAYVTDNQQLSVKDWPWQKYLLSR